MSERMALISAENALGQTELLLERKRFAKDAEAKVLAAVVGGALKEVRREIAAQELERTR